MPTVQCLSGDGKVITVDFQDFDPRIHTRLDAERVSLVDLIPEILCVELTVNGIRTVEDLAPLVGGVRAKHDEAPADRYRRALELGKVGRLAARPAGEALAASRLAVAVIEHAVGALHAAGRAHATRGAQADVVVDLPLASPPEGGSGGQEPIP
jgi:hypothetical protein